MTPKLVIGDYLKSLKKKTISLIEMELLFSGIHCSYQELAEAIQELESEGILQMIINKGRNGIMRE
jgi:xanthine/uracil permease